MSSNFGSFEIQSTPLKQLITRLHECADKRYFIVAGDCGTGRTTFAGYVNNLYFQGTLAIIEDDGQQITLNSTSAIVVTTHERLARTVQQFDRNKTFVAVMPSLVERKADIVPFSQFFIDVLTLMNNTRALKLSDKSIEKLTQYNWPGNFHELEAVLEAAFLRAMQDSQRLLIEPEHIDLNLENAHVELSVGQKLDEVERKYILQTLYFVHQNRTKAAEILGISIRTLRNKINQYREEGFL